MFKLTNKIIVITGGAGLLGQQHAESVAEFGATPIILDLDLNKAEEVAARLAEQYSVNAVGMSVNITIEKQVATCCQQVLNRFGKIDILINNAANNPKVDVSGSVQNSSRLESCNNPFSVK